MLLIVFGHLFAHTSIREIVPFMSFKWNFAWACQAISVCAVNAFVLLSGFLMVVKPFNSKRIFKLWGLVIFYSIVIFLILLVLNKFELNFSNLLKVFAPTLSSTYWFFTCYFVMCLFSPFINKMLFSLNSSSSKVFLVLVVLLFFIFPVLSFFFPSLDEKNGYGIIQFICLYTLGGIIRLQKISLKKSIALIVLVANTAIVFLSKIIMQIIVNKSGLDVGTSLFYHYNSIFQLINAFCLLVIFNNVFISNKKIKIMTLISSSIFSVYLIHDNPFLRGLIWNDSFSDFLSNCANWVFVLISLTLPILIFVCCIAIDVLRHFIVVFFSYVFKKASLKPVSPSVFDKIDSFFPSNNRELDE